MSRALFLAAFAMAAPAFGESRFFSGIDDVPLAPGLEEAGAAFDFAGEQGRVIGAAARGPVSPRPVRAFYLETLPALGWSLSPGAGGVDELVFLRGRERLSLTISRSEAGVEVALRVFAQPAPPAD